MEWLHRSLTLMCMGGETKRVLESGTLHRVVFGKIVGKEYIGKSNV